tara:strand:+ start:453 stop:860 length:408 start_codon:yes stop_codon:yes gene_type:complete
VKFKKKYIFFYVNNINQANEVILTCKLNNIIPILCFKFYMVKGLGANWILELKNLLNKKFKKKYFKILVNCNKDYGLFIFLTSNKINYLDIKADKKTLIRLKNIAKKNKVIVNPKYNAIDLSRIKKIKMNIEKRL